MINIKSRFLKRVQSVPSINSSSNLLVVVPLMPQKLPNVFSDSQTVQDHLPNNAQQKHITNTRVTLVEAGHEPRLSVGTKNVLKMSSYETDVFEDCVFEFDDSILDMITSSSSSSSSSSCSSPTGKTCECIENCALETLSDFEEKCPPGGVDKVILYTTSLRGIRKTYEDCNVIKLLLQSFRVVYIERDVSMHLEYRDELWQVLGGRSLPPRLFIKGRHVGGADQVVKLNESGMLKMLLEGIPVFNFGANVECQQCSGMRFLLCLDCNGSCKIYEGGQKSGGVLFGRCPECNENGLIKCSTCSY